MSDDRRSRITVRRYTSSEEADRHDLEFWREMPEAERVLQVWRLSLELSRVRGEPPHEPGLHRSIARIIRNKRATGRPKDLADLEGLE